jgi:bromodomain-containing protein 7/9
MVPCTVQDGQEQDIHFDWIRDDIETAQAERPESYVHDMVYGGVDGLAYVRSLAEFMRYTRPEDDDSEADVKEEAYVLGCPLAKWVEENVVDVLTDGRHALLKTTADVMNGKVDSSSPAAKQAVTSLHEYPVWSAALFALRSINANKMDMAALINHREELYLSEEEWLGKELRERRVQEASAAKAKVGNKDAMEVEETANPTVKDETQSEGPEELKEVLEYVAAMIVDINRRTIFKIGPPSSYQPNGHNLPPPPAPVQGKAVKQEEEEEEEEEEEVTGGAKPIPTALQETIEDPLLRNLRLNLLALAKRAPLDTLDLSKAGDKVPEDVRSYLVAASS